jgi:hypothetical protein
VRRSDWVKIHTVDLSPEFKHIYIIPISDLHLGDPHVNFDKFYGYRKWIQDNPNAFVLLNGDIMNTAIKSSVSNCYEETMRPKEQLKLAVKLFEPIKDRILAGRLATTNGALRRKLISI